MSTYLLRIWIPDRPGALGQVASRVGSAGGDVIGIDILERGAGRAIDEIWIEMADDSAVDLLIREVDQVDGVDVEDCRQMDRKHASVSLFAFERAGDLLGAGTSEDVLHRLAAAAADSMSADAVLVVDRSNSEVLASTAGADTDTHWLAAFGLGAAAGDPTAVSEPDLAVARMESIGAVLVLSRRGMAIRSKERVMLTCLVRVADHRAAELSGRAIVAPRELASEGSAP